MVHQWAEKLENQMFKTYFNPLVCSLVIGQNWSYFISLEIVEFHVFQLTNVPLHSAAACIYSEFSKFGLHAYFWKIQVILRCRNPFLAFFSDCAVDFKGPTSDTFSYVFPIPSTEKQLKQL